MFSISINLCSIILEMTNEQLVEYYGYKAADAGKFLEWQTISSSLREEMPKVDRATLAERAYKMVVGSERHQN